MKYALADALGTAAYVVLVALFFFFMEQGFADKPDDGIIVPIAMLMLLVFSVALVGTLIFGRPAMWYVDGKKKEALALLGWTLGIFLVLTVLVLFFLVGVMS
jgi:hypothetical protein